MNLYTGNEPRTPEGHATVVNNKIGNVRCTTGQRFGYKMFYLLWLTIIGGIVFFVSAVQKKNYFKKTQIEINNLASNIDIQLEKRSATLIKLLDATKGHVNFERETMTQIAGLRSGATRDMSTAEKNDFVNSLARNINISVEKYPDLKAAESIQRLMSESAYIEKEIAANRRLYNQHVTTFNTEIFMFPWCVLAEDMNLSAITLFIASDEAKKDVRLIF